MEKEEKTVEKESIKDEVNAAMSSQPPQDRQFVHPEKCRCASCTGSDGGGRGKHVSGCKCTKCSEIAAKSMDAKEKEAYRYAALKPMLKGICKSMDKRFAAIPEYYVITDEEVEAWSEAANELALKSELMARFGPEIVFIGLTLGIFGPRGYIVYSYIRDTKMAEKEKIKQDDDQSKIKQQNRTQTKKAK